MSESKKQRHTKSSSKKWGEALTQSELKSTDIELVGGMQKNSESRTTENVLEIPELVGVVSEFFSKNDLSSAAQVNKEFKDGISSSPEYKSTKGELILNKIISEIREAKYKFKKTQVQELINLWNSISVDKDSLPKVQLYLLENIASEKLRTLEDQKNVANAVLKKVGSVCALLSAAIAGFEIGTKLGYCDFNNDHLVTMLLAALNVLPLFFTGFAIDEKFNIASNERLYNAMQSDIREHINSPEYRGNLIVG